MNDARAKAEDIAVDLIDAISEIARKERDLNKVSLIAATLLTDVIEQALLAAGPRVVSEKELSKIGREWTTENVEGLFERAAAYFDFVHGFKKAASMNAIAHLESVFPSFDETYAAGCEGKWSDDPYRKDEVPSQRQWILREVLNKLGLK